MTQQFAPIGRIASSKSRPGLWTMQPPSPTPLLIPLPIVREQPGRLSIVEGEDRVARELVEAAVFNHHPGAALAFFGGVEDEVQGAVEAAVRGQVLGRSEQGRSMASWPQACILPAWVLA